MPDEMLDIVNEQNELIGKGMRSAIHHSGQWHRGVHLFLLMPDNKLLLQQRSAQVDYPHAWDCMSEHLQVGETYLAAAQRGLREELGITTAPDLKPLAQFRMDYGPADNMICELFQAKIEQIPTGIDPQEVATITSRSLDEVQAMLTAGDGPFTRWFEHMLRWYLGHPSDLIIHKVYDQGRALPLNR